jgi:hypothetical protein
MKTFFSRLPLKLPLLTLAFAFSTHAGQVVYPAKGQSAEQQKKDEAECHRWATDNSGYDPANPPVVPQATSPRVTGSGARVRGAAGGAIIGAIADGDAGDAALAGAAIGGLRERRRQRTAQTDAQNSAAQKQQDGLARYNKARAACLEGRGYTVK